MSPLPDNFVKVCELALVVFEMYFECFTFEPNLDKFISSFPKSPGNNLSVCSLSRLQPI